MVAPRGKVKLVILFDTPLLCSSASMVSGNVALEDEVENAVKSGVAIFLKWVNGLACPTKRTSRGRKINAWISNPATTHKLYMARLPAMLLSWSALRATSFATMPKMPSGVNFMMKV